MKFLRAYNKINVGNGPHELSPAALRHATEEPEHHLRLVLAQPAEDAHFSKGFLLGHVPDAASVEQDDIRRALALRELVTACQQIARDLFGITFVHLAAVGFNEYFGHSRSASLPRLEFGV